MDKFLLKKAYAVIAIALLILNMIFAGMGFYSQFTFWIVLGVIGALSLFVMKVVLK